MKADLSSDETPEKHTQTKILWCDLDAELKSCRFKSQNKNLGAQKLITIDVNGPCADGWGQ